MEQTNVKNARIVKANPQNIEQTEQTNGQGVEKKKYPFKPKKPVVNKLLGYAIIAPHQYRHLAIKYSTIHMLLAQIEDVDYWQDYREAKGYKILDNGFYELGKCLSKTTLRVKAEQAKANCVVLPDGDFSDMEHFLCRGLDVMLVPTTLEQMIEAMDLAISYPKYSVRIGVSHIHAARVVGAPRFDVTNRYQFIGSALTEYGKRNGAEKKRELFNKLSAGYIIHLLGLGHYPMAELKMIGMLVKYTCDSNSFIWPKLKAFRDFQMLALKLKEPLDFNYISFMKEYEVRKYLDTITTILQRT